MQKKYLSLLVTCAAAAALLSGCGESHTHQTSDRWDADLTRHWKICTDCGETAEEIAHTPDDSDTCTVCGAQILDWGESKSLFQFNADGEPLKTADYDADGNVITETIYTYECDAAGLRTHSTVTTDGTLTEESTYTVLDGESVLEKTVSYMDDGSSFINEYDVHGNTIRLLSYDSDGNLDAEITSEYALSAEGEWYEAQYTEMGADGSQTVSTFAENGDQLTATHYEADGSLLYAYAWEYTYDADGNWQTVKCYSNGFLTSDLIYTTLTTEDGSVTYPETITEYEADGSRTTTIYDENDNIISQIRYDADGNAISD